MFIVEAGHEIGNSLWIFHITDAEIQQARVVEVEWQNAVSRRDRLRVVATALGSEAAAPLAEVRERSILGRRGPREYASTVMFFASSLGSQ